MRKKLAGLVLVILVGLSSNVHADIFSDFLEERDFSKFYYGIGFSDGNVKVNGSDDRSMGNLSGTFGVQMIDLLGVELQVGAASDDSQSILSETQVFYTAAMLRLGFRVGQVGVYGLMGQAVIDSSSAYSFSKSGEALGVGLNLFGNETTSLNLHFLRIDDGAFTTASIGFQYYFGGYR